MLWVAGGNPRPPALSDNPAVVNHLSVTLPRLSIIEYLLE